MPPIIKILTSYSDIEGGNPVGGLGKSVKDGERVGLLRSAEERVRGGCGDVVVVVVVFPFCCAVVGREKDGEYDVLADKKRK